jgi:hypothetical protein
MSHVSREARQVRQEDKGVASELASDVRELDVVPDSRTSHYRGPPVLLDAVLGARRFVGPEALSLRRFGDAASLSACRGYRADRVLGVRPSAGSVGRGHWLVRAATSTP